MWTCSSGLQIAAELWRFPDRTIPSGKKVSAYLTGELELDDAAVHMLFSQNRWECRLATVLVISTGILPARGGTPQPLVFCCRDKLEQALMSGTSLIVDRYAYSGAAYTAAKHIAGLDLQWCKVTLAECSRLMLDDRHMTCLSARLPLVKLRALNGAAAHKGDLAGRGLLTCASWS